MAWQTIDRNTQVVPQDAPSVLSKAVRDKIRSFFPRYDTKRAVLLPALHIVQDALGYVSWQAMGEIAELLDIHPSDVMDTVSFYTEFWTQPKGEKVITVCRSISCELMGGAAVLDEIKKQLGIEEHGTTPDGRYSLTTEECLAGCDHSPCLLIGEKMHKCVKAVEVSALLADADNDKLAMPRNDLFDAPCEAETWTGSESPTDAKNTAAQQTSTAENGRTNSVGAASVQTDEIIDSTSDVREMRDAD